MKRQFQWLKGKFAGKNETYKNTVDEDGINYIVFESGRRVSTDLLGDYIAEISEDGVPFINSSLFDANVKSTKKPIQNNIVNKKKNNNSDKLSLTDVILSQLKKQTKITSLEVKIPILDKSVFSILNDVNDNLLDDLISILVDKYINKEALKNLLKESLIDYYSNEMENVIPIDTSNS